MSPEIEFWKARVSVWMVSWLIIIRVAKTNRIFTWLGRGAGLESIMKKKRIYLYTHLLQCNLMRFNGVIKSPWNRWVCRFILHLGDCVVLMVSVLKMSAFCWSLVDGFSVDCFRVDGFIVFWELCVLLCVSSWNLFSTSFGSWRPRGLAKMIGPHRGGVVISWNLRLLFFKGQRSSWWFGFAFPINNKLLD